MDTAVIFGVGGQDGHYLARLLVDKGYRVVGVDHRSRSLPHLPSAVEVRAGNLSDLRALVALLEETQPDEIYNVAGISSLPESFADPAATLDVNGLGVVRLLQAINLATSSGERVRFCQASSSQMFGGRAGLHDERSPFHPENPYAVAKLIAHYATSFFRGYKANFACNAILFNHESPRRKDHFVSRRISKGVARISLGFEDSLELDNLEGRRDWGFAGDYATAMWAMLQQSEPGDFVIATGQAHSVRDFVQIAFSVVGIEDWESRVKVRRSLGTQETDTFPLGNASKARKELGWMPQTTFEELVSMMVENDLALERG